PTRRSSDLLTPRPRSCIYYPPQRRRKECFNMATVTKLESRNELVKKEKNRLKRIFSNIDSNQMQVVSGLITQAARLRVLLDELWEDITSGRHYESFSQSEKVEPSERERPVAKFYNSRDQSYKEVIKQLVELLANEEQQEATDDMEDDLI